MTAPIRFADLTASRWPNGAGRRADVANGDGWLVSYAWLDGTAPFSDYGGWDRCITLVTGPGFVLDFAPPTPALVVDTPYQPTKFDGGWPATCRLPNGGPCLVLNAMSQRDRWRQSVTIATADQSLPAVSGPRFVILLHGQCRLPDGATLGVHDAWPITSAVALPCPPGTVLAIMQFAPLAG